MRPPRYWKCFLCGWAYGFVAYGLVWAVGQLCAAIIMWDWSAPTVTGAGIRFLAVATFFTAFIFGGVIYSVERDTYDKLAKETRHET